MKLNSSFLFLCCYLLVGCSSVNSINSQFILNDTLVSSYENINHSVNLKRSNLLFNNGVEVDNCNAYFLSSSMSEIEESIHNQLVKSEYLICDALNILSNSSRLNNQQYKTLNLGEELLYKLDLRSFPSSLHMASSDSSYTLKSIFPNQTTFNNNVAVLETEDWLFTVEVVAVVSVNGNSSPDWIVWIVDESKSGNYRGYSTFIIYDPEQLKVFNAVTYP